MTLKQLDRCTKKLAKLTLIEKHVYWFSRNLCLYVRPTPATNNYLAAATTWKAAHEFLPKGNFGCAEQASPKIPQQGHSNEIASSGEPNSPKQVNSNNMITQHETLNDNNLTGAGLTSCAATCGVPNPEQEEESPGKETWKLSEIAKFWKKVSGGASGEITPSEMGQLAKIAHSLPVYLEEGSKPGEKLDHSDQIADIVIFAGLNWGHIRGFAMKECGVMLSEQITLPALDQALPTVWDWWCAEGKPHYIKKFSGGDAFVGVLPQKSAGP